MVGQTQKPWVRQNPTSCLTQCQTEKKSFRQLCVIFTKNSMVHDVEITECKLYMRVDDTKNYKRDNPVSMTRRIQNLFPFEVILLIP